METLTEQLDFIAKEAEKTSNIIETVLLHDNLKDPEIQKVIKDTYNRLIQLVYPAQVKAIDKIKGLIEGDSLDL